MNPYYEEAGGIAIYHGDAREVCRHVTAESVITFCALAVSRLKQEVFDFAEVT